MQIGPGFRIRATIDEAEANGVNTPLTEDSFHSLLLYHLKGVCNTHFGGWHLHRPLSQSEFGRFVKWRECFHRSAVNLQGRSQCKQFTPAKIRCERHPIS